MKLIELDFSYIVNQKFLSSEGNLYDTESYLKLLLLSHIWGTDHALYINNIKHYFNPYTLKLEPISSDQVEPRENDFSPCAIHFRFTSTDIYNNLDKRSLSLFNVKEELNNIRNKIASNIDNSIKSNQKIFPLDNIASTDLIKKNMELMSDVNIAPYMDSVVCNKEKSDDKIFDPLNYLDHVYAHHYSNGKVKVFNLLRDEVEVLYIKDSFGARYTIEKFIPGYIVKDFTPIVFETNYIGNYDSQLFIVTSYMGEERETLLEVTLTDEGVHNPLINATPDNLKFLHKRNNKDWLIRKGVWQINNPLVIQGNLTIEKGTTLKFNESSYLIINGNLISTAPKDEKILLTSSGNSWGGLYVYESSIESKLKNTTISNTTSIQDGILDLSGGVTFYNADVSIEEC